MKKGLTELVFILDKSGSMAGLESDTIGGYNAMLKKQKDVEGECRVTTVLFDNNYELLHDRIDIRAVKPITEKEYFVGGTTALLDAMGRTINKIINVQKNTDEDYRAEKAMFVIITDGYENASREYTVENIRSLIQNQKDKYGWEFIFLGANIDAIETATSFGISQDRAQNYHADSYGIELNFCVMDKAITVYRQSGALSEDWKDEIEKDYRRRGSK